MIRRVRPVQALIIRLILYRFITNRELIAKARFLNRYLMGACARFGAQAQSETARLLIDLKEEMARRLRQAEIDSNGLPVVDGVTWNPDDPLAVVTTGIPPFGMLDVWITYLRNSPTPEITRRRRRQRQRITEIEGDTMVVTGQGPQVSLPQIIDSIHLQLATGSFAYWFWQNYRAR